jgi:hypothetical protein
MAFHVGEARRGKACQFGARGYAFAFDKPQQRRLIAPRAAGSRDPQHRLDKATVILARCGRGPTSFLGNAAAFSPVGRRSARAYVRCVRDRGPPKASLRSPQTHLIETGDFIPEWRATSLEHRATSDRNGGRDHPGIRATSIGCADVICLSFQACARASRTASDGHAGGQRSCFCPGSAPGCHLMGSDEDGCIVTVSTPATGRASRRSDR